MRSIGSVIRELRKDADLSQGEMAVRIGMSQTSLSQIEKGVKDPHRRNLDKISKELGVSLPVMWFMAMDEADITPEKREVYRLLKPLFDDMINRII